MTKKGALWSVVLTGGLFLAGLCLSCPPALAAGYPDHPIQLVVPNVAGALTDVAARLLAGEMEKLINGKIIINNKPGASSVLGTDFTARAKKDGYTIVYTGASALVYVPVTSPEVIRYDPVRDLECLGLHFFMPQTITVRADAPWKTFPELVAFAKANPGKVRISTTGVGSAPHFIVETLQAMTGARFTHVPFEGGESVVTALLGGHVEATSEALAKVKPHVDRGTLRILLMTDKMAAYPAVPTIAELGYSQGLPLTWWGLWAPAGIPDEVRKILVPAVEKAVRSTKTRMEQLGNVCEYRSPADVRRLREEEYRKIYDIAVRIGLRKP